MNDALPDIHLDESLSKVRPYDLEIASLFVDMRKSSGQPLEVLANELQTDHSILLALEKGDLESLPAWEKSSPVITRYAQLLSIDPTPILRRIALSLQARQKKRAVADQQNPSDMAVKEPVQSKEIVQKQVAPEPELDQPENILAPEPLKAVQSGQEMAAELIAEPVISVRVQEAQDEISSLPAFLAKTGGASQEEKAALSKEENFEGAENVSLPVISGKPAPVEISEPPKTKIKKPIFRPVEAPQMKSPSVEPPTVGLGAEHQNIDLGVPDKITEPSLQPTALALEKGAGQVLRADRRAFDDQPQAVLTPSQSTPDRLAGPQPVLSMKSDLEIKKPIDKGANPQETIGLRAERRGFERAEQDIAKPPQLAELLKEERRQPVGLLFKVVLVLTLLAAGYIAWFVYSEPKLLKMLLGQLPFIS